MAHSQSHFELDFRKLFESMPGVSIVLLADYTIVAVSDGYLKAARLERQKIIGKGFFEIFPDNSTGDYFGDVRQSFEKVLRERVIDRMPPKKYGAGSDIKYWRAVNVPMMDANGEVAYIVRRAEDMTGVLHQEDEWNAIKRERDLFFSHSFDLLAIVGTDGYFKRLNPAFERTLGYSEAELCSKPIVEFLHPDDVGRTKKGIQTLTSGTPTIASKNRYRCKDGTYKWFSWNTAPMGSLFYSIGRDSTDQVAAEERIRQLNDELSQKNEDLEQKIQQRVAELQQSEVQVQQLQKMDAIGRLAGGIAHDFNNLLGATAMYCDLLKDEANDPAAVIESACDIRGIVDRGAALTRQLLVFSRKQILQNQTIDLNILIQGLLKMLNRLIGENIQIVTNFAPELKTIKADPGQIEQVILNLVVNARDAMPEGGEITLETSNVMLAEDFTTTHLSVTPGPHVVFAITDRGTGMTPETQARLFEPFFTTKPVGKGTGLGLPTAYGIIKQSGGTIWVYSELGKGSIFKVYFPSSETSLFPAEPSEHKSLSTTVRPETTVLLVEDEERLRALYATALKKSGYKVLELSNGKDALEVLEKEGDKIHLLLTDVVMPKMGGIELAKLARSKIAKLPVLYMSGYANDPIDGIALESDGEPLFFIQKPFDTAALLGKVRLVLEECSAVLIR
jgi:two-component system, cell cycle sensor histidine kinase and response regulator CckA